MTTQFTLVHDQLVIAEGNEEATFIQEMVKRGIVPPMDVGYIGQFNTGWGITGLLKHLITLAVESNFTDMTKQVVVVADHDDGRQFDYIRNKIAEANDHADVGGIYSVPVV